MVVRGVWFGTGVLFLAVALVGVVVPLLPTTPFVIVAAACFSRSSPRVVRWIEQQRLLGPTYVDWSRHRVIRPYAKWMATGMIVILGSFPMYWIDLHVGVRVAVALVFAGVLGFIWSRRSQVPMPEVEAAQSGPETLPESSPAVASRAHERQDEAEPVA